MPHLRTGRRLGRLLVRVNLVVVAIVASIGAVACNTGLEDLVLTFNVDEEISEKTILGGVTPGELISFGLNIEGTADFQNQNVERLDSVEVGALELTILPKSNQMSSDPLEDGNPDNWGFLAEVEVVVRADGLPDAVVAEVPAGSEEFTENDGILTFTATGVDMLEYVLADGGYSVAFNVLYANAAPDNVIFDGEIRYKVGAKIFASAEDTDE